MGYHSSRDSYDKIDERVELIPSSVALSLPFPLRFTITYDLVTVLPGRGIVKRAASILGVPYTVIDHR